MPRYHIKATRYPLERGVSLGRVSADDPDGAIQEWDELYNERNVYGEMTLDPDSGKWWIKNWKIAAICDKESE